MTRKKQARSNKQTRQSNTAHPRQSLFLEKMSCLGWDSNPGHSMYMDTHTHQHCIINLHSIVRSISTSLTSAEYTYLLHSNLCEVLLIQLVHGILEIIPQTLTGHGKSIHTHARMHAHTHTYTHIYTRTHAHTQRERLVSCPDRLVRDKNSLAVRVGCVQI